VTQLKVRRMPFDFGGDIPFQWQPANPDFAHMANAVGVLAIAFEKFIVAQVREAMPLITDREPAEEAEAFLRQEAQHARAHRLHAQALVSQYPGLQQTIDEAVASFDHLRATRPLKFQLAYTADLEATFTPIFKLMLDHEDVLFRPGDQRVASLFVWHFVEEVEHRSSALLIYNAVIGEPWYRLRVAPAVFRHVLGVYGGILRSFNEHVPEADRLVDAERVAPAAMWKREFGSRVPVLRRRLAARGERAVFEAATAKELLATGGRLIASQLPHHRPEHQPIPQLAGEWHDRYDGGENMTVGYRTPTPAI
jgi:predicted metal-dependent hydrolase